MNQKLEFWYKRFKTFCKFMDDLHNENDHIPYDIQDLAEAAFKRDDIATLKRINKEMDSMAKTILEEYELRDFEQSFNKELGLETSLSKNEHAEIIGKIISSGRIKDVKEYKLIRERYSHIECDETQKGERQKLSELMDLYIIEN